eukprot:CAMPEP_0184691312 /NCGR_PEP_ID=MMETSP0313-20130426/202_1 /TAXON_ID=2792 /ORGANISM="Porphyridium aerugineum, Strain SAG 1380-2" /LENGTH=881 /DNA_ID=CAMNT_0027149005 /DNA_START=261 /DNA_END=2906 /DNA_ORIENTATION=-
MGVLIGFISGAPALDIVHDASQWDRRSEASYGIRRWQARRNKRVIVVGGVTTWRPRRIARTLVMNGSMNSERHKEQDDEDGFNTSWRAEITAPAQDFGEQAMIPNIYDTVKYHDGSRASHERPVQSLPATSARDARKQRRKPAPTKSELISKPARTDRTDLSTIPSKHHRPPLFVPVVRISKKTSDKSIKQTSIIVASSFLNLPHWFDPGDILMEKSNLIGQSVKDEFRRLRSEQPKSFLPLDKRKPLYPDGLRTLMIAFLITVAVVRFTQFVLDVLMFSFQVVMSSFSSVTERIWSAGRFLLGVDEFDMDDNDFVEDFSNPTNMLTGDPMQRFFTAKRGLQGNDMESAEWVNGALRKIWKAYNPLIEAAIAENLQKSIDESIAVERPPFLKSIRLKRFHLGDRALWIRSVEEIPHQDPMVLTYNFDARYDGDSSLLLMVELYVATQIVIPVMISDLDLDAKFWIRARLIKDEPFVADASIAFVQQPRLSLSVKPFKALDVMYVPGLSTFLRRLLSKEIPAQFTLPMKNDIFKSSSAFVPFLQQVVAERVYIQQSGQVAQNEDERPEGILSINLYEAKGLIWTASLGLSNPFCSIQVGKVSVRSKSDRTINDSDERRGNPIWNQRFDLEVLDWESDKLRIEIFDRYGLKNRSVGYYERALSTIKENFREESWVNLRGAVQGQAKLHLRLNFRRFVDQDVLEEEDYFIDTSADKADKQGVGSVLPSGSVTEVESEIEKEALADWSKSLKVDIPISQGNGKSFEETGEEVKKKPSKGLDLRSRAVSVISGIQSLIPAGSKKESPPKESPPKEQPSPKQQNPASKKPGIPKIVTDTLASWKLPGFKTNGKDPKSSKTKVMDQDVPEASLDPNDEQSPTSSGQAT